MSARELRSSDLRRVNEVVHRMHACSSYSELEQCMHLSLHELIGGDVTIWNEISANGEVLAGSGWPAPNTSFWEEIAPAIVAHLNEHPLLREIRASAPSTTVLQWAENLSHGTLSRTQLYNEAYLRWPCRAQATLAFHTGRGTWLAVSVNRATGRAFSRTNMALLALVVPQLHAVYRRTRELNRLEHRIRAMRRTNNRCDSFWMTLGPTLVVSNRSANSQVVLNRHFGRSQTPLKLPEQLNVRLHPIMANWSKNFGPDTRCRGRFTVNAAGGSLLCDFSQVNDSSYRLEGFEEGEQDSDTQPEAGVAGDLKRFTHREREVLRWLAEGKTNPEIAVIVGIARRTAENHTQAIFEKLGIHKRSALIRRYGHDPS